jgi:hypothetical protein
LLVAVFLFAFRLIGQEAPKVRFEKVSDEELSMKTYPHDTTADAVILFDDGTSYIKYESEPVSLSNPKSIENAMFATKTGSRLFIPLNIFNQVKTAPSRVENRRMPVYRAYAFVDKESVILHLPKGFQPESTPKGKTFATEFGEYKSTINVRDNQLVYFRELKMNRSTWPKERYSALVDFYTAIINADKVKLVLKEEPR